jgi:hypothetical protein
LILNPMIKTAHRQPGQRSRTLGKLKSHPDGG